MGKELEIPLRLETDGGLRIVFVGTGGAFSKKFFQTNLLVLKGDTHLMIDIGTRATEALTQLGLSVVKIRNYLVTHSHADHIGGLEEVMLVNRYGAHQKSTIIITPEFRDVLWEMSLKGGASFNEEKNGRNLSFEDFFDSVYPERLPCATDADLRGTCLGNLDIRIFRTKHIPDSAPTWRQAFYSYGVIIDKRVLFSSDLRFDPELILGLDREYGFETIFHDCQFFTGGVHASIDEIKQLPAEIKAKMILTHYWDTMNDQREKILAAGFAGFAEQWVPYDFPDPPPAASGRKSRRTTAAVLGCK